jgi:RecA/RadA recombinase
MIKKETKDTFKFLGTDFQQKLIAHLLTDRRFANKISDLLSTDYFEETWRKKIVKEFIDAWKKDEVLLDVDSMLIRIAANVTGPSLHRINQYLNSDIPEILSKPDGEYIKKYGLNFCKQQQLKVTVKKIDDIINTGDVDRYYECEELIKGALELGQGDDDIIDVCDDPDSVLAADFRKPIPTGISGLDEYMDGGLAKSELGVILAPFGVGKTTMITKMANHAKDAGYNVLQIFFEDNPKVIQRKHYTCWYNSTKADQITINDLNENADDVKEIVKDKKSKGGIIKLKKFASDGTTIPMIRQYIRKLTSQGFKPDIVFLDYIDCVQPSKQFDDQNAGEGNVMRAFETMLSELDIAGWTAVQGNRSSIGAGVVEAQMMGGSIKRGQIGHFVVSVAKTLEQKELGTATMAILKSRFGKDGIIFSDIIFDNGRIVIDLTNAGGQTFLEAKKDKEDKNLTAVKFALDKKRGSTLNKPRE